MGFGCGSGCVKFMFDVLLFTILDWRGMAGGKYVCVCLCVSVCVWERGSLSDLGFVYLTRFCCYLLRVSVQFSSALLRFCFFFWYPFSLFLSTLCSRLRRAGK